MGTKPNKEAFEATHKNISVWLPRDLVAQLDALLAARVAGDPGIRASRHGWIAAAIQSSLAAQVGQEGGE